MTNLDDVRVAAQAEILVAPRFSRLRPRVVVGRAYRSNAVLVLDWLRWTFSIYVRWWQFDGDRWGIRLGSYWDYDDDVRSWWVRLVHLAASIDVGRRSG